MPPTPVDPTTSSIDLSNLFRQASKTVLLQGNHLQILNIPLGQGHGVDRYGHRTDFMAPRELARNSGQSGRQIMTRFLGSPPNRRSVFPKRLVAWATSVQVMACRPYQIATFPRRPSARCRLTGGGEVEARGYRGKGNHPLASPWPKSTGQIS
jgi:hypothetical protein